MNFSDLGFKITVAYEDLSDVWPVICKAIKARLPLHQVTLINRLGTPITVDHMPVELVSSFEPAVQKLQQYAYSALTWFRQPAASLVLISCNDAEDYKKNFRLQLRAMIDSEGRHPLSPEPVFVYIAPPPSPDLDPKAAGRVVDAMRRELGSRRRERVVRVDLAAASDSSNAKSPSSAADLGLQGIDEVVMCLKAAIAASLEARIGAYGEVARQHLTALQAARPDVCFSDLFLLKDSLAVMMEAAGLVEDSVREYLELEVAYQQVEQTKKQQYTSALQLPPPSSQAGSLGGKSSDGVSEQQQQPSSIPALDFSKQLEFLNGGLHARRGIDEASGIWSSWRATRLAVQGIAFSPDGTLESISGSSSTVPTPHTVTHGDTTSLLALRQAVFASQSRVLLKLQRYAEVLHRGLSFFHSSFSILAALEDNEEKEGSGRSSGQQQPKLFKEAWTFAGCVSLAAAVASEQGKDRATAASESVRATPATKYYLQGVLEEGEEPANLETEAFDWRLGIPIANFQEQLFNNNSSSSSDLPSSFSSDGGSASSVRSMYCLLGQLYCKSRAQLETLGAARGLYPPEFKEDIAACSAALTAAASAGSGGGGSATPSTARASPGAGHMEEMSSSPRRGLHKTRSISPSRASLDLGSVRSSFLSGGGAAGGGGNVSGHLDGLESGDEASSLSIKIHNQQNSPFDVQGNLQTIDLVAAGDGGRGGGDGQINNDTTSLSDMSTTTTDRDLLQGSGKLIDKTGSVSGELLPSRQQREITSLGPMAAAALGTNSSSQPIDHAPIVGTAELTSAQISAEAAEKGVELLPVSSLSSFPPAPVSPSTSPLAAGVSQHRRTNTATSTKSSLPLTETDSGVSTPRSASVAATAGGASAVTNVAPTTSATTTTSTSTTSSQDAGTAMRKIERILDDLWALLLENNKPNGSRNEPSQHKKSAEDADSGVWKPVHWRLRRALASQTAFADLWQALTTAAALSFDKGGRRRQAVQCRAEIADCLASKGNLAEAAKLYEVQCRIALAEGWTLAAAAHLPKLAACQAALQSAGLPHTAAAMLKLAATNRDSATFVFTAADAAAAVGLLCKSAALPNAALPLPPSLLPPRQPLPGPGASGTLPFIISDTGMVDLSSVLVAQPLKGSYSKFYCRNDATGRPILCPTSSSPAAAAVTSTTTTAVTHVKCAVGDVNVIVLEIFSLLPASVALHDVRLLLLGMQELTAVASPRATSPHSTTFRPSMQNMPLSSTWSSTQHGSVSTPHHQVPTPSSAITGKGSGAGGGGGGGAGTMSQHSPFYRADSFADEGPRFTTEWQDTEDLHCSLVSITYKDEEEKATALLTPLAGAAELRPGMNILRFMAAPVKRGLYRPVSITAELHNLEICLDVEANTGSSSSSSSSSSMSLATREKQGHFLSSLEDSAAAAYPVVLEVEPTLPRVSVTALSATGGGSIVAGQKQWIGLQVLPGRDVLENATLAVTWPVPTSEIARKMSGILTNSTSTGISGNVSATGGGSSLSPELSFTSAADGSGGSGGGGGSNSIVPALLPQHNAALVNSIAPSQGAVTVVEASSLVHQDGHQEIILPAVAGASPLAALNTNKLDSRNGSSSGEVTVWWWIEAGTFMSPPEQVKVSAPGQQQQQLQDGGVGGGYGIESNAVATTTGGGGGAGILLNNPESSSSPHVLLHLPLYLQYLSGCRRTFSKVVSLSLYHPFAVTTSARELPNGSIVTQFNVSSLLSHAVTVTGTALALQPGLHLLRDIASEVGIFPMTVLPHSIFSLSFIVTVDRTMAAGDRAAAQARLQQAAKLQPTALQVSYTVGIEESCGAVVGGGGGLGSARSGAYAGHRTTVHGDTTRAGATATPGGDNSGSVAANTHLPSTDALLELEKTAGPSFTSPSSSSPFTASEVQHQKQHQQYQECSFTHHCAFELSPLESDIPGAVVLVQLLGPFSAVAGQAVSLCWRLERAGAAVQGNSATTAQNESGSAVVVEQPQPLKIQFEIGGGQGGDTSWRPLGRRSGAVILEPYDGAIATIEAMWIPLVAGTVAAPSLRLADVEYQECFDVGSGYKNYLVVTPSPY